MAWFGLQQFREPAPANTEVVPAVAAKPAMEPQPRTMTESFQSVADGTAETAAPSPATSGEDEDVKARLNQTFNDFTADSAEVETAKPSDDLGASSEPEEFEARARRQSRAQAGQSLSEPGQPAAESGPSKLEPHIAEPISYWELPQGVRDGLPEIKISVLVYSEKPEDRFLLTNGQRLAEKDSLESGLVLDEIRRDGAVFLYRKYRFLVKG